MGTARRIPCEVSAIMDHGGGVYAVKLQPLSPIPRFMPGQFLHLALDEYDPSSFWPDSRVFSIASPPSSTTALEILYSVKGSFTTRMSHVLSVGRRVWVKLPYGEFFPQSTTANLYLWAGGTGISAFASLLQTVAVKEQSTNIRLIYGIRTPSLFLYGELIRGLNDAKLVLSTHVFVQHGPPSLVPSCRRCCVQSGMVSVAQALQLTDHSARDAEHLVAGPPGMVEFIIKELRAFGVPNEQIRTDAWE